MSERIHGLDGPVLRSETPNRIARRAEESGPRLLGRERVLELEARCADLERRCVELESRNRALRHIVVATSTADTTGRRGAGAEIFRVLERIGWGTIRVDATGCVRQLDRVAASIFERPRSELVGRPLEGLLDGAPPALWQGAACRWEGHVVERDDVYVEVGAGPPSEAGDVHLVIRDVTERRRMERDLRRAQRLDAIGRLSAGIAHDMNNVLMAIVGSADRATRRVEQPAFVLDRLREIRGVAEGSAAVVRRLTTFARDDAPGSVVALDAVVRDVAAMLRPVLGEDVDLAVVLDAGGVYVPCDTGRLEQVLVNLAVNARDAMPSGGRLEVRTLRVCPGTVRIEVRDTGWGIEPEVARRLFEPFFTTKHDGTGLGLAVVRSVAAECGGRVEVGSTPGCGTSVVVELPEVTAGPQPHPLGAEPRVAPKTVLLVEDDPLVRSAASAFLERGGHRVIEASDAASALSRCAERSIDALVTDVVLGPRGGVWLADEVRARQPGARVLYVSGYAHHELVRRGHVPDEAFVLPKPYSERELRTALAGLFAPAI